MIVAIESGSLKNHLDGLLDGHFFEQQAGTEKHPEYPDHSLVYRGFEIDYSSTRKWERIRIYARKTTPDEIEKSMAGDSEAYVHDLDEYRFAVEENQTLYDSVLVEARINCVQKKQKNDPFNKKLKQIQDTYAREKEDKTIIEKDCPKGATTYTLRGLFGQDVFDAKEGLSGPGLLGGCIDSIINPYKELKKVLRRK